MAESTKRGGLSNVPLDGFWRVAALIKRKPGTQVNDLERLLVELLRDEPRLIRLVRDVGPKSLDAEDAAVFPPQFDDLLEFWFESASDAAAVFTGLDHNAALIATSDQVIDREHSAIWLARCSLVKPETGASGFKLVAGSQPADGLSASDAQRYWRHVHPEVARSVPGIWDALTRYVQFHGVDVPEGLAAGALGRWRFVPINADACYADARAFGTSVSSEAYRTIVRPDEEKFSSPRDMMIFLAGEEKVLLSRPSV